MSSPERPIAVGFIGLGIMGAPMARNLVDAGFAVTGYNRSRGPVDALVAAGGRGASSIADAVAGADVVVTVLPDGPDVEAVVAGDIGVLHSLRSGALLVDMSTVDPAVSRRMAALAADFGIQALDAPVSGGQQGAIDGTLSIMVGGDADAVAAAMPVFEALGRTIVHVGPAGAGQTVKAANQLLVGGILELVAEAIVFLGKQGVDAAPALRVIAGGLGGNTVLDRKAASMLAHHFEPGFRIDLHHKDMGILLTAARDVGAVLPLGAVVAQQFVASRAAGDGALDHSALLRVVERLSGVPVH
ncbi:MAG: 2-hydroxy-3-oxopropionate reductase [Frankiaceae bacterium]|nr:2-hydroxy-3-oxopropionate reductase [Frankiaceae bacterium]